MAQPTSKRTQPAPGSSAQRVRGEAARLFAERGFAQTSMRDLARATGMSLSGLYHHFPGKNELLYRLQHDTFSQLLTPIEQFPKGMEATARIESLILNHLEFFARHITEMKVLSHESGALTGSLGQRMRFVRRRYYQAWLAVIKDLLRRHRRRDLDPRVVTLALFGMVNWIYTWYRPETDGSPEKLARQMTSIFLRGVNHR